jgi:hypothetical protein
MTRRPWSAPGDDGRPRSPQTKNIVLRAALPAMLSSDCPCRPRGSDRRTQPMHMPI